MHDYFFIKWVVVIFSSFYDVCRWEDLPPMPFPLLECISISYGGQFHVVGKKGSNYEYDTYVIFNLVDQRWKTVEDLWPFSKLSRDYTTGQMVESILFSMTTVWVVDTDTRDWCPLRAFPAVVLAYHARPLKPYGFCFIGFKQYLYVVGGMALRYDSDTHTYDIVKLNTVRFCDSTSHPLEWHNAASMSAPSSGIIGCALVEEWLVLFSSSSFSFSFFLLPSVGCSLLFLSLSKISLWSIFFSPLAPPSLPLDLAGSSPLRPPFWCPLAG